jgi:hypothetical protein
MLTTLLFITIIVYCGGFRFIRGLNKLTPGSMNSKILFKPLLKNTMLKTELNARLTSTTYYDDYFEENEKRRKKMGYYYNYNYDYNYEYDYDNSIENKYITKNVYDFDEDETLYTLIWFDCEDCRRLLNDVKNARKKILYIDGSYYFFDEKDTTNTPIFYKNDELFATDIFSIYEELFVQPEQKN